MLFVYYLHYKGMYFSSNTQVNNRLFLSETKDFYKKNPYYLRRQHGLYSHLNSSYYKRIIPIEWYHKL